jgi:serine/threonine protein kinase
MQSGKYQYIKKLATGGMAEVWLAKQTGIEGFNRHVVVKRILPHLAEDAEFVQMFLNEAKIVARFNHANIAQIYELGEENGTYFIAMEFVHGEDLGRVMRRAWASGQWVARHVALRIMADACQGLHYAHTRLTEQGQPLRVVHRDISPQNILISFDGAVKVVDFGIAKAAGQISSTRSGAIKGKFAYMPPEQAAGKPLDARTDIYALGLVLYELITGVRPLKREGELATLQAALSAEIEPPSAVAEVPQELDGLVMRALARTPDDRYRDAREFHSAIEQYLVDHQELATSVQVAELMEALFADRLAEEKRLGVPNPSTESSVNNPALSSYGARRPPSKSASRPAPASRPAAPAVELPEPSVSSPGAPATTIGPGRPAPARPSAPEMTRTADPEPTVMPDNEPSWPDPEEQPPPEEERPEEQSPQAQPPEEQPPEEQPPEEQPPEEQPPEEQPPEEQPPKERPAQRPTQELVRAPSQAMPSAVEPRAAPKRRASASQRVASGSGVPTAPSRRLKSGPSVPAASGSGQRSLSEVVDLKALRARASSRLRAIVAVVALISAVALIAVFRVPLRAALTSGGRSSPGSIPLRLSVTTNPPTEVEVHPPRGNRERAVLALGRTPVYEQSGAFVGDTVVLINHDRGIRWEELLELGDRNSLRSISKTFTEVTLKVFTKPKLKLATVWRLSEEGRPTQKLGQIGLSLQVFEGVQRLAVVSDQLSDPVPFEVAISDGQKVTEKTIDVSASLEQQPPQ